MVVGIALLGVVTASVAAWFVRLTTQEEEQQAEQNAGAKRTKGTEVARLRDRVESLEAKIDRLLERDPGAQR